MGERSVYTALVNQPKPWCESFYQKNDPAFSRSKWLAGGGGENLWRKRTKRHPKKSNIGSFIWISIPTNQLEKGILKTIGEKWVRSPYVTETHTELKTPAFWLDIHWYRFSRGDFRPRGRLIPTGLGRRGIWGFSSSPLPYHGTSLPTDIQILSSFPNTTGLTDGTPQLGFHAQRGVPASSFCT